MNSPNFNLLSLLIVSLLALFVPVAVSRIRFVRIPIVVGEVLVGIVIGKSGFNIIQPSEWLQFLQFFGLSYLMFVAGLEIDFRCFRSTGMATGNKTIRKTLSHPLSFGAATTLLTFFLCYGLSSYLHSLHMVKSPLFVALIMTTTSLTIVVPVLKEYQLERTMLGQTIIATAMFADFATMLMISIVSSILTDGLHPSVLLIFVLLIILAVLYFVFRHFRGSKQLTHLADGTAQLGIRAALALMITFVVLSQWLGVEVILGTFLAGALMRMVNDDEETEVHTKLDAIGFGFLTPIFFIMVGVNFNIKALLADPKALILVPVLFLATCVFKAAPAILLRLSFNWRETGAGMSLLTSQMSVTVAAAEVGLRIGVITVGVETALVLVAMLTAIISPVVFGKVLHGSRQLIRHHRHVYQESVD